MRIKPYDAARPLGGLSDKQLEQRIQGADRAVQKAEAAANALDSRDILQGRGGEALAHMDAATSVLSEAARERRRRQAEAPRGWVGQGLALFREREQRAKETEPTPAEIAIAILRERVRWLPLQDTSFRAELLTAEEGAELRDLARSVDRYLLDERGPLTDEERDALERLLGKAAGSETYFEKRREAEALQGELAERREARRPYATTVKTQVRSPRNRPGAAFYSRLAPRC
jgi:hypothetical protein